MGTTERAAAFTIKFILFIIIFIICAAALIMWASHLGVSDTLPVDAAPKITLVIDAGHGGRDGGAVGVNGSIEKDIDLAIAKKLYLLSAMCGCDVKMTRTEDEMLSLPDTTGNLKGRDIRSRIKIADETPNALLVSIHVNSYPQEKYNGLQVFYSTSDPMGADAAISVQKACAEYLQPDNERRAKPAASAIYLLNHIKSPAILVECGFISNAREESLLCDPAYQTRVASVICGGLLTRDTFQTKETQ